AAYFLEVMVDVVRMDRVTFAVGADVLEQHLAWQLLASLDHPRDTPIRHAHLDLAPALAPEQESHGRTGDCCVAVAKGGEAERGVFPRVLLVADPRKRHL